MLQWSWSMVRRTAIALTCKIGAARSQQLGGTMVMVFYVLCCVLCVIMCARGGWFSWVSAVGSYLKYNTSYYGIVLRVGISIVKLDTCRILVKYLAQENGGREKNDKSVVCVVCCKKLLCAINDFPNGKYETYICRNRYMCGWLVFCRCFFYEFWAERLIFWQKTTILSRTYEGIGMFVDDWKINPISLLGGHGNQKRVYSAVREGMA